MIITSVVKQKNNSDRYNIFIDGVFKFSASNEDIIKNSISEGNNLIEEEINSLCEVCEFTKAYKYALYLIEHRDYTCYEIENKLKLKLFSNQTIIKVSEKLKDYRLIDDNKYLTRYVNDSISFKRNGIRKVMYDLRNKGISQEEIESIEVDIDVQYQNAYYLGQRKYKQLYNKPNAKEKIFRYLINKGYEFEISKKVIDEIIKDANDDNVHDD